MDIILSITFQLFPTAYAQDLTIGLAEKASNLYNSALGIGVILAFSATGLRGHN